jgi:hypothetical protein
MYAFEGRDFLEASRALGGQEPLMEMYAEELLHDHGLRPSNNLHDIELAFSVLQEHVDRKHELTTQHKSTRWMSVWMHSKAAVKAWHSTSAPYELRASISNAITLQLSGAKAATHAKQVLGLARGKNPM